MIKSLTLVQYCEISVNSIQQLASGIQCTMNQEKYSLTWYSYSDHLKSMMKELMMNEDFSDATLVTEDKKYIKANMNILSACSPVFKDIFKKERNLSSTIYLRGILYSEMESIMQFIYLGEATFEKERMDEFLAVSKSLEIKELCEATDKKNEEPENKPPKKQFEITDYTMEQASKGRKEADAVDFNQKYECGQCHMTFTQRGSVLRHKQSVHDGVKYACDQCEYKATQPSHLTTHIKSQHEGVTYACDQCDHHATHQSALTKHIQSMHECFMYDCNQCDHQYTDRSSLSRHIKSKHKGVKYACDQCDHRTTRKVQLRIHIENKH